MVDRLTRHTDAPGRLGSRRRWMLCFFATCVVLWWLPWVSLYGWIRPFIVIVCAVVVCLGLQWVLGMVARKVDPLKGAAPGDGVTTFPPLPSRDRSDD